MNDKELSVLFKKGQSNYFAACCVEGCLKYESLHPSRRSLYAFIISSKPLVKKRKKKEVGCGS